MDYVHNHKRNKVAQKDDLLKYTSKHLKELQEFHDAITKNREEQIMKKEKVVELDSDIEEQYRRNRYAASSGWGTDNEY